VAELEGRPHPPVLHPLFHHDHKGIDRVARAALVGLVNGDRDRAVQALEVASGGIPRSSEGVTHVFSTFAIKTKGFDGHLKYMYTYRCHAVYAHICTVKTKTVFDESAIFMDKDDKESDEYSPKARKYLLGEAFSSSSSFPFTYRQHVHSGLVPQQRCGRLRGPTPLGGLPQAHRKTGGDGGGETVGRQGAAFTGGGAHLICTCSRACWKLREAIQRLKGAGKAAQLKSVSLHEINYTYSWKKNCLTVYWSFEHASPYLAQH